MTRRELLRGAVLVGAAGLLAGHTPYRQWQVYRQSRLIIVVGAEDPAAFTAAEGLVAVLAAHLADSRPTVARARDTAEVVSLLASRQLDVALLDPEAAGAAAAGRGPYAGTGPVPLRALGRVGSYLLVCREEVPADRAYQVTRTLAEQGAGLTAADGASVPLHRGAVDYYRGRPGPR